MSACRCQDIGKLTPVAEALCALLLPFEWPHVYLPLLPDALIDCVEAPVPLLAGVDSQCLARTELSGVLAGAVVVHLDADGVIAPMDAGPLPQLPADVLAAIRAHVQAALPSDCNPRAAALVLPSDGAGAASDNSGCSTARDSSRTLCSDSSTVLQPTASLVRIERQFALPAHSSRTFLQQTQPSGWVDAVRCGFLEALSGMLRTFPQHVPAHSGASAFDTVRG